MSARPLIFIATPCYGGMMQQGYVKSLVTADSAQLTLVKGDLMGILRARTLSVATVKNMRQNLGFAFFYNAMGIPLAAGLFYPLTGHLLSPMIAALAMSVSSASVVFNALRLKRVVTD